MTEVLASETLLVPPRPFLVVLDLDHTLLATTIGASQCPHPDLVLGPAHRPYGHAVIRPGALAFIDQLLTRFDVAIWSAASHEYVHEAVDRLLTSDQRQRLRFVWSGERCTVVRSPLLGACGAPISKVKPLKKIWRRKAWGYTRSRTRIIDDTPSTYARNRAQGFPIPGFHPVHGCASCRTAAGEPEEVEPWPGLWQRLTTWQDALLDK